jgi:hypothetical protein
MKRLLKKEKKMFLYLLQSKRFRGESGHWPEARETTTPAANMKSYNKDVHFVMSSVTRHG